RRYRRMSEDQYKALLKSPEILFTRLATVLLLTLPMLKRGFEEAQHDLPGKESNQLHTMHIQTVEIFGRDYISKISFNESRSDIPSIPVLSEEIRGVRFALGKF